MECSACLTRPAAVKRSLSRRGYCRECFCLAFEDEIHELILSRRLLSENDRVCIGVSGGKDSAVLAHILASLKERHGHLWQLFLLAIDEGIAGYRDDSLDVVKHMDTKYKVPLKILNFKERFGFTMDQVVALVGRKTSCTICGAFRRQLLEVGSRLFGATVLCTGHTGDDNAETVLLNLCRGDLKRLTKVLPVACDNTSATVENSFFTCAGGGVKNQKEDVDTDHNNQLAVGAAKPIRRIKPLMHSFEKEVVLYARFKGLEYFSTECTHAPEAYRGYMRTFVKQLEAIDPAIVTNILSSEFYRISMGDENAPESPQTLHACSQCGFEGSGDPCGPCKIISQLKTMEKQRAVAAGGERLNVAYDC